jgi:hypothetical protein
VKVMPSPFRGMDPYLEDPALWTGLHVNLIAEIQATLNRQLRPRYYAAIEERVYLLDDDDPARALQRVPDVRISEARTRPPHGQRAGAATVAVAEPIEIVLLDDEVHEPFLEVVDAASKQVVTVIEVVSPSNKIRGSEARRKFLAKKRHIMCSPTHWVEIDLLRQGARFHASPSVAGYDYLVHVSRANDERRDFVWPIRLAGPLPGIDIPLWAPDPDTRLNLQNVFNTAYDRSSYDLRIDYQAEPVPPLTGEDAEWARQWLAGNRKS